MSKISNDCIIAVDNIKNKDFKHAVNILTDYYDLQGGESCIKWYKNFHLNEENFKLLVCPGVSDKNILYSSIEQYSIKIPTINFYEWLDEKGFRYKLDSFKLGLL